MLTKENNNEKDIVYLISVGGAVLTIYRHFSPIFHIEDGRHVVLAFHLTSLQHRFQYVALR